MNKKFHAALIVVVVTTTLALAVPAHSAQSEAAYMTATRYDLAGRVTGTIAPDPDVGGPLRLLATRNTYSGALLTRVESGQLTSFPNEDVPVASWVGYGFSVFLTKEFTYDANARKTTESIRGTDGFTVESLIQYSYDTQNRVQCKAVRMNKTAFGSLPASACTPGTAGAEGPDRITRYTYDTLDQVLTEERAVSTPLAQTYLTNVYFPGKRLLQYQTDANGNKTELQYDGHDRLKKRLYPHPTSAGAVNSSDYNEYDYDENGNVKWERKRNTATISTTFDSNNRPKFRNLSNNTYAQDIAYDYDLRGLTLTTMFATEAGVSTGVGITNLFNGLGRLENTTSNVGGFSRIMNYQFDLNGNRTRVAHPDGNYFQYRFDGLNRVDGIFENASSTALLTVTYRSNGQRWTINRANGATTTLAPDNAKRLQSFAQDFAGSAEDLTNTFSYSPASQVTQLVQSNNLYSYGGNQNRTGSYTPNGLNQYTSIGGLAVSYDANGNLISDGAGMTFTYDMENRLVSTTAPMANLKYDPLGRLAEVTVIPGTTTQFLYDGDALVAEYTVSGSVATQQYRYVHGDQVDEPWLQYDGANLATRRFLHADHQGSIIAHTGATANVMVRLAYDNYGVPANGPSPIPINAGRFGFTGQTWLKELGLNYYKARMYHPKIGRFLQTDPIFYEDDMNMYAYVGNDPMLHRDPSGECKVTTDAEGNKTATGICANDAAAGNIVKSQLSDPASKAGQLDQEAIAAGKTIVVAVGDRTVETPENPEGDPVDGAATQGVVSAQVAFITIDPTDTVTVKDAEGNTRQLTTPEIVEHELGHASDELKFTETNLGDKNSGIKWENEYREKKGIKFKRTDPNHGR